MARHHTDKNGNTPFSAQEEAEQDTLDAASVARRPLEDWEQGMRDMEGDMPQSLEDHIEHAHAGSAGNPRQQKLYDDKRTLRGQRP